MKAKWGALMVDGRGKLGGQVATKNRQGAALRNKSTPVNRRTNAQQNVKSLLSNLSDNWRALTDAQRAAWESASQDKKISNIFGDSYSPTGKNMYMIINQGLSIAGSAVVAGPPANTPATGLTALSVATNTIAATELTFAATPVPASHVLVIEATRPLSAGVGFAGSQFRFIQRFAAAQATPADITAAYAAKFGVPVVGKRIFFRAYQIHTVSGARSIPLQVSGVTA